jgi:hypothetical protein
MASHKPCHYIKAHKIRVLTYQSLRYLLNNSEASIRIGKWLIELS